MNFLLQGLENLVKLSVVIVLTILLLPLCSVFILGLVVAILLYDSKITLEWTIWLIPIIWYLIVVPMFFIPLFNPYTNLVNRIIHRIYPSKYLSMLE